MILEIGIDEVGRGAFAGPIVACAFAIKSGKFFPDGIKDSKKLSYKKRCEFYDLLKMSGDIGFGIIDNDQIDKIGIEKANLNAMELACYNLINKIDTSADIKIKILIDGRKKKLSFEKVNCHTSVDYIIGGDDIISAISAASICAKVHRDKIMEEMHKDYPDYCWDKNKGYGTQAHRDAIKSLGLTSYHRKSFAI